MNTPTTLKSILTVLSFFALSLSTFASNNVSIENTITEAVETSTFETSSKAAFVNAALPSAMAPASTAVASTSLVFFLDKAEYYTVSIMDEFNKVILSKEINGKKGLNAFLLDFKINADDQFTFSVYGENGVDFSGNIPHG